MWPSQLSPDAKDRPCIVYIVDEDRLRFTFSCLMPMEINLQFLQQQFLSRSVALLIYLEESLKKEYGDTPDVHSIIESPDFKMPKELIRDAMEMSDKNKIMGSERIHGIGE